MLSPIRPAPRPSRNREIYNELLIERGDLTYYLKKLRHWADELEKDNEYKEGTRFKYPEVLFQILAIEHNLKKTFRTVEGFGRMICGLLGFPAPRWTTIWYRIQNTTLASLFEDKSMVSKGDRLNGAIDSTGLKLHGPGEYLHDKHHPAKRSEFVKLHTLINTRTHQILVKGLTSGFANDSPYFKPLVNMGTNRYNFDRIWADKAYSSNDNFELLSVKQIQPGLLLKKNITARTRGGSFAHSRTAWEIKQIGLDEWKRKIGYGNRWAVERTYGIFKMLFGEHLQARQWPYIKQEIFLKVEQLNHYLNDLYSE
jgi:hypothetical protein